MDRREQERRRRSSEKVRLWTASEPEWQHSQPGRASDHINSIEHLQAGDLVIPCLRVSGRTQDHNGNLSDQQRNLLQVVQERGARVISIHRRVRSGCDPAWLIEAAEEARAKGAKLLAESTDRFIRNPAYHSKENPDAQARRTDLEKLSRCTEGVELITHLHPDASPEEVRSYQRKRGQRIKGNKGGRSVKQDKAPGHRNRFREEWLPHVLDLHSRGASTRFIWKRIRRRSGQWITRATLLNWIRSHAESEN